MSRGKFIILNPFTPTDKCGIFQIYHSRYLGFERVKLYFVRIHGNQIAVGIDSEFFNDDKILLFL